MCCFAGPVRSVDSTRIFGRLSQPGKQVVAYQMKFESDEPNAMILPLPTLQPASEDSIRFLDLSGYEDFFADLNRGFPYPTPPAPMSRAVGAIDAELSLEVHDVGNFEASFVPTMDDFERLDPRFVIAPEIWAKIPEYRDYSFAVFQLKDLAGESHPMAFEFRTRFPDTIFFPTVHIHDGEVHRAEDFDHMLYAQGAGLDAVAGDYTRGRDKSTRMVRSKFVAKDFVDVDQTKGLVDGKLLVHRKQLRGNLPNRDTLIAAKPARAPQASDSTRQFGAINRYWAAATASLLLPLGWIIRRRNQLKDQE